MSFLVSGEVVWKLRSIVLTLANDISCGIDEHIHSDECYEKQLVCSQDNEENHIHSEICYTDSMICKKEKHIHTAQCYSTDGTSGKNEDVLNVTELESVDIIEENGVSENIDSKQAINDYKGVNNTDDHGLFLADNEMKPDTIYIDAGNGISSDESNSQSSRYEMIVGASFRVTFIDDKNTDNFFYDFSGMLNVEKNSASTENGIRKVTAKVTAVEEGDAAVYIGQKAFYITITQRTPDILYASVGNSEKIYYSNSSTDRYRILKNHSFKLIIYDSENTTDYFYDPNNSGNVTLDNNQSTVDGKRIVTCTFVASGEGNVTVAFRDKRFYLNIIDRLPGVIYLVSNGEEKIQDQNSASNRNIFSPGDKFSLCMYENISEGSYNYFMDTSYQTGSSYVPNMIEMSNEETFGFYSGQVRKVTADIKVSKDGDAQISYGSMKYYLSVKSYELGKLFIIDSEGNETSVENSADNPYVMSRDEILTLCYYEKKPDDSDNLQWFHCADDSHPYEPMIMNYGNSDKYVTDSVRKITGTFTAVRQGQCTIYYKDISFYVDIHSNSAKKNVIYVNTALGERDKDKVNEYIDTMGGDSKDTDGKYYFNTSSNRYVMYLGESVDLSVYLDNELSDRYFYIDDNDPCMVSGSANKSNVYDAESGLRKSSAKYTAVKPGRCTIKVSTSAGILSFYVMIRDPDSYNSWEVCDHADIEVSDGGFYDITKTVIYADGTSITTKTSYDSYITAVNLCQLFKSDDTLIMTYVSSDYVLNGKPGESQYELTSKYNCAGKPEKQFNPGLVNYAKFNVKMLLRPTSVTVVKKVNGEVTEKKVTDINDTSGDSDVTLPNVDFTLGIKSKIDALNKCPNHSGLDFNVSAALNDVISIPPVMAEIELGKELTGQSLKDRQFSFSLIDQDGKVVNSAYNDINGKIVFEHYFLTPGTYNFTVVENIPQTPENYIYDNSVKRITVTVTEKIINGEKMLVPEVSYQTDKVFRNIVSAYTDLKVVKSWSDGNINHSDDKISFVIYRRGNNEDEKIISIDGVSKFELSSSSGWSKTFKNLPIQEGEIKYTYRIEEDTFEGYTPDYEPGIIDSENISQTTVARIENTVKKMTSVSIRKEWTDSGGNPLTGNIPYESVIATLKRDFKKIKIPVSIEIYSSVNTQQLIAQFREYAYTGSDFSFTVYNDMNKVRVSSVIINNSRNGDYSNNVITVKNIEYGDIVRVYCDREYNQATDGAFYLRQSFTASHEGWERRGALLGDAYTTNYTDSGNGRSQALKVYNRTAQWNGTSLNAGSILTPGQKYSISAYVLWNNVFTDSGGNTTTLSSHSTKLIITLQYKTVSDDTMIYVSVASKSTSANTWELLQNTMFEVPDDAVDPYLVIETSENSSEKFSDLYLDEVTVAPEGTIVSVSREGTEYIGNAGDYQYSKVSQYIPDDVKYNSENWTLDTMDTWKEIEIKASENWIATVTSVDLNEKSDRIYRYYVSEKDKVDGFARINPTDRVSSNTVSDPLIIENRQIQYELPATGGIGKEKYIMTGTFVISLSVIYLLCLILKMKRRKDSG